MKVYIVEKHYPYEGYDILAVFSKKELAEAYVNKLPPIKYDYYEIEEFEVDEHNLIKENV